MQTVSSTNFRPSAEGLRRAFAVLLLVELHLLHQVSTKIPNHYSPSISSSTPSIVFHNETKISLIEQDPNKVRETHIERQAMTDRETKRYLLTPTASLANQKLSTNGVLLRVFENFMKWNSHNIARNRTTYCSASFVHSSILASNVVFFAPIEMGKYARIGTVVASRFERDTKYIPPFLDPEVVDCRAYYPTDAWSDSRNIEFIASNTAGSSCFLEKYAETLACDSEGFANKSNHCACNDDMDPKEWVEGLCWGDGFKPSRVAPSSCWFPGTHDGISRLIMTSNELYSASLHLFKDRPYQGWTECSASPNIIRPDMSDAIFIELPFLHNRSDDDNTFIEDYSPGVIWDLHRKLKTIHYQEGFKNHPVLFFRSRKGADPEYCQRQNIRRKDCKNGYRKDFVVLEYVFSDGSFLGRSEGDTEVRYVSSISSSPPSIALHNETMR